MEDRPKPEEVVPRKNWLALALALQISKTSLSQRSRGLDHSTIGGMKKDESEGRMEEPVDYASKRLMNTVP